MECLYDKRLLLEKNLSESIAILKKSLKHLIGKSKFVLKENKHSRRLSKRYHCRNGIRKFNGLRKCITFLKELKLTRPITSLLPISSFVILFVKCFTFICSISNRIRAQNINLLCLIARRRTIAYNVQVLLHSYHRNTIRY